ncbi:TolC family protein [Larkinella punicea]|nr:TolC family protein [Larkinella punicea]
MKIRCLLVCILSYWIGPTRVLQAQSLPLVQLLQQAEQTYPALRASRLRIDAQQKNIDLIQNAALPTLEGSYQANLATYNNITGLFHPQGLLPISGPPSIGNRYQPVSGSAASLLLNWQPITFGLREAQRTVAKAEISLGENQLEATLFNHKVRVIDAYLDGLLLAELVGVYQQNVTRAQSNLTQSRVLVGTGLRSGADTALFAGELSRANVELLQARQAWQEGQIQLAQLVGSDRPIAVRDSLVFIRLPTATNQVDSVNHHPLFRVAQQQVRQGQDREALIRKARLPRLGFWAIAYGRGSGVSASGEVNPAEGLLFSRFNYGAGLLFSVPLLNGPEVRLRSQQQQLINQAYQEDIRQTELQLTGERLRTETALQSARLIASELPAQKQAAQSAFTVLRTRYNEGLTTFADFAQAQYGLVRAEVDYKKSYWSVWKAWLGQAAANGDLSPFLNQLP